MAKIINVPNLDGSSVVYIVAGAVDRVLSAPSDAAGATHTEIDFGGGLQLTTEPVAQVSAAVTAAGVKLVQFTALDGTAVYVNAASVSVVRPPAAGEYPAGANSVVLVGGYKEAFRESPLAVVNAL